MPFPSSPVAGTTTYTNPEGTQYKFNLKGAWQLMRIGQSYLPPQAIGGMALAPTVLPTFYKGTAISTITFAASGGSTPYTYALSGGAMPTGLTWTAGAGTITGTPTTEQAFTFQITATDSLSKTVTLYFSGYVYSSGIVITPNNLGTLHVGTPVNQAMSATGGTGPYGTWTVAAGTIPTGLSLNSSTGAITGTPLVVGNYSFQLTTTDSLSSVGKVTIAVTVAPEVISITPLALPQMYEFVNTSVQFNCTGNVGGVTWSATGVPAGMAFSSSGLLSGAPAGAGNFTLAVTATDSLSVAKQVSMTGNAMQAITIIWKIHVDWPYVGYCHTYGPDSSHRPHHWRPFIDMKYCPTNLDPSGGAFVAIDMNGYHARFPGGAPGAWSPVGLDLPSFAVVSYPNQPLSPYYGWDYDGVGRHIVCGKVMCWSLVLGTGWNLSSYVVDARFPLFGVTWGVGLTAVAVGAGGHIIRTTDGGVTWTVVQQGLTTRALTFFSVEYAAGIFVATGCNIYTTVKPAGQNGDPSDVPGVGGAIYTSTDGVTWTARSLPPTVVEKFHRVRFLNSQFVIVGGVVDAVMIYSADGINWFDASPRLSVTLTGPCHHVEYGPFGWIICGRGQNANMEHCGVWTTTVVGATTVWVPATGAFQVWNAAPVLHCACQGLNTASQPMYMCLGNNYPQFSWGSSSSPDFNFADYDASPIAIYSASYNS